MPEVRLLAPLVHMQAPEVRRRARLAHTLAPEVRRRVLVVHTRALEVRLPVPVVQQRVARVARLLALEVHPLAPQAWRVRLVRVPARAAPIPVPVARLLVRAARPPAVEILVRPGMPAAQDQPLAAVRATRTEAARALLAHCVYPAAAKRLVARC